MSEIALMYGYHIFWALFLGGALAFAFRRSWNAENRKTDRDTPVQAETVVFPDPVMLPFLLITISALYIVLYGLHGGMEYIATLLTDIFAFVSGYFTLLLLLLPVLRKHYTARACATLWLIPVLLFYQPTVLVFNVMELPLFTLYVPETELKLMSALWFSGAVILFAGYTLSHLRFARFLKQDSYPVKEQEILEVWEERKKRLDLQNSRIELRYSPGTDTPLTIGMREKHRILYLPAHQDYAPREMKMVFDHELHHIRRRDTHTKFFLKFCCALGWFHPFVWIAVRRAEEDLELSCDEIVLRDADSAERKKYAELLLTTAGKAQGFTTCLSPSARALRYRMRATVFSGKKKRGLALLFAVAFFSCFTTGQIRLSTDRQPVAEVLSLEDKGILEAGYGADRDTYREIQDRERLSGYLSGLHAEKVIYAYNNLTTSSGKVLSGRTADQGAVFYLMDNYLEVDGKILYHIVEPVDWEYLRSLK